MGFVLPAGFVFTPDFVPFVGDDGSVFLSVTASFPDGSLLPSADFLVSVAPGRTVVSCLEEVAGRYPQSVYSAFCLFVPGWLEHHSLVQNGGLAGVLNSRGDRVFADSSLVS